MLPKIFYPNYINKNKLTRIGPKSDGGYVIHKKLLGKLDFIISCGLSDNWEFEKELLEYNKNCQLIAYDHSVNGKFWWIYTIKNIYNFLLLKKLRLKKIKDIFKFFEYKLFFRNNNKHFIKKVGNKNTINEISLNRILKYIPFNDKKILLKIDIEDDEYKLFTSIEANENKIDHLIVEFHDVPKNLKKIIRFIKKLKILRLAHIHGNNSSNVINYVPNVVEITFINKINYPRDKFKNSSKYPIFKLDYSNNKKKNDIKLKFSHD